MASGNGATLKRAKRIKSRGEIVAQLTRDPTAGYRSSRYVYYGELFVQQLPLWRLWTGRMMLTSDPIVNFSLDIRNAALAAADVIVTSRNERVQTWVQKQWDYLWEKHRDKLVSAKKWGFAALQVEWELDDQGLLNICGLKDFAPEDCRGLEVNGKLVGQRVRGEKVWFPQALWITFNAEFGHAYGTGCLRRSYPPWYEKWMDHGAKRLLQQRMIKDAWIGDIFKYPYNQIVELPDGTKMPWRDVVRELGENRLSGGVMAIPMIKDRNGNDLVSYDPPQDMGRPGQIFEWLDHVNEGILHGAGISTEVIQAAETGSGFSGRSIPFLVVLNVCTMELIETVKCVDDYVLRPVASLNFGGDPDYEIKPKSLVESFGSDLQGSPLAGGSIGTSPGQAPPQPLPQQIPQRIPQQQYEEEGHKFSSTQFNLPEDLANDVRILGHIIDETDLAEDGREDEPHVTALYGLHTDDAADLEAMVSTLPPIAIQLGPVSVFHADMNKPANPGKHDVLKIDVISKGLHELHNSLKQLPHTSTYPDYKPHITIAYVKPGWGAYYAKRLNLLEGRTAVFDRLIFSNRNREHFPIKLTGQAQFAEVHAPKGGIVIAGKAFKGGEFIPNQYLSKATPQQKQQIQSGITVAKIQKEPARRGEMKPVTRTTEETTTPKGKIKKVPKLHFNDGSQVPEHIPAGKIPPAWKDVYVSEDPDDDVWVMAKDAKGRVKLVYSDSYQMRQAAIKYARNLELIKKRQAVSEQIQRARDSDDPITKEAAACMWLIEEQATRPGSEKDTKAKVKAYGATTLRAEHVFKEGNEVHLKFIGKEGIPHDHVIKNPELAKELLRRKRETKDGKLFNVNETQLLQFARTLDGGRFTPKDFRTLKATTLAIEEIQKMPPPKNDKEMKQAMMAVAEKVSSVLGNRPKQAIESYINPMVWAPWSAA